MKYLAKKLKAWFSPIEFPILHRYAALPHRLRVGRCFWGMLKWENHSVSESEGERLRENLEEVDFHARTTFGQLLLLGVVQAFQHGRHALASVICVSVCRACLSVNVWIFVWSLQFRDYGKRRGQSDSCWHAHHMTFIFGSSLISFTNPITL